jgi:hypothetical protein
MQAASEAAASAAKQAATEAIAEQREATRDAAEKTSTEQMAKTAAQQALAAQAAQSVVGGQVRGFKFLLCLGGTYFAFLTCFWEWRERQRCGAAGGWGPVTGCELSSNSLIGVTGALIGFWEGIERKCRGTLGVFSRERHNKDLTVLELMPGSA